MDEEILKQINEKLDRYEGHFQRLGPAIQSLCESLDLLSGFSKAIAKDMLLLHEKIDALQDTVEELLPDEPGLV